MRETQILRGLHKARAKMGNNLAAGYAPRDLRRGAVNLKGPGTTTSDSIHGVSLSKGESVLPAKTTAAIGPANIARLIEKTNGKPPARGLRAGAGHATGAIPGMTVTEGFDTLPEAQDMRNAAEKRLQNQPKPAMGNTTTAGAAPLQEPAGPQTFKQRATNMFKSGKAAVGGMADSATAPFKTAVTGAKALGAGVLGAYAGNAAADAARSFDTPSATPVAQNANGNAVQGGVDVTSIPGVTDQQATVAAGMPKQQHNWFQDTDAGRNVGNTLNAAAMIPGVGVGARGAMAVGTGVISKTARAATGPLAAGALQGAAANVREGSEQATQSALAPRAEASPYAATTAAANTRLQHQGPMGDDVNPYHGDLSAQINAAMKDGQTNLASTGMRANDIYKTKQANGTVAYSGYGDGTGRTGKLVSGDGTALQGNGTVSTMPNDQTARTLSSAQSGATSAALQAAAARGDMDTVRQHYQSNGGTFAGRTAAQDAPDNSPQSLIMAQIQRGLASGQKLTPAGVAALQALNTTDKNYKANMFGHEISRDNSLRGNQIAREGYEKDLAIAANTNKRLLTLDGMDRTAAGSKAVEDYIKTASSAVGVDNNGVAKIDDKRAADLGKYISSQVQPIQTKYGPMTLAEAAGRDPDAFKTTVQRLDSEKSLDDLINASAGRSITGVGSQNGGRTELAGSTRQNAGLINEVLSHKVPVGSALASHALMPFTDSTMVDFKDGRGGIVSVPLREIAKDRHAYTALQAMFAQQKGQ